MIRNKQLILKRMVWLTATFIFINIAGYIVYKNSNQITNYFQHYSSMENYFDHNKMTLSSMDMFWLNQDNYKKIALRAYSKKPPLHLKAITYQKYANSSWSNNQQFDAQYKTEIKKYDNHYLLPINSESPLPKNLHQHDIEIHISNNAAGMLYYPLDTSWLLTKSYIKSISENNAIRSYTGRKGYRIFQDKLNNRDHNDTLKQLTIDSISLNQKDLSYVKKLASKIVQPNDTIAEKVNKIHQYLIKNHVYTLRPEIPYNLKEDPVVYFLKEKLPAHCQYFSSASIFLLRACDVPCKMVNGFLCYRKNEFGDYYFSTKLDAHAWVEYYDNGWRTFDPTSNTIIDEETRKIMGQWEGLGDYISYRSSQFLFYVFTGELKELMLKWWDDISDYLLDRLYYLYSLILILVIFIVLMILKRKKNRRQETFLHYEPPKSDKLLNYHKKWLKFKIYLLKKGIINNNQTILEMIKEIEKSSLSIPRKNKILIFLAEYSDIRYKANQ